MTAGTMRCGKRLADDAEPKRHAMREDGDRLVPLMWTSVPPWTGPWAGEMDVTVGVG